MEKEEIKSIIYLEGQVKTLTRELNQIRNSCITRDSEIKAKNEIIKSLEETNERLLKLIEKIGANSVY